MYKNKCRPFDKPFIDIIENFKAAVQKGTHTLRWEERTVRDCMNDQSPHN